MLFHFFVPFFFDVLCFASLKKIIPSDMRAVNKIPSGGCERMREDLTDQAPLATDLDIIWQKKTFDKISVLYKQYVEKTTISIKNCKNLV